MDQREINEIKADIDKCHQHADRNGSQRLYRELVAKYSSMIPDFSNGLSTNGKVTIPGIEFDYRDELHAIASKLEMYLIMNNNPDSTKESVGKGSGISDIFIQYASDILAATNSKLTGALIVRYCNSYAVRYGKNIPVSNPDFGNFGSKVPNKRTALYRNLSVFEREQQFVIIKELCELSLFEGNAEIENLKKKLIESFPEYSNKGLAMEEYEPTGWLRIDRSILEMKDRLPIADTEEKIQAIAMIGRETLISIAQQVYQPKVHQSLDNVSPGPTDAKRMLEAYIEYELKGKHSKEMRALAKEAVDLANNVTHSRNAQKRDGEICCITVKFVANLIKVINDTSDSNEE